MAKEKKVEQITDMEVDFAQWFTDVCVKAELVDYSGVKGLFILRPYGYAIWENIQSWLDRRFKELGHENVSMPMLIPESLLQKEKDHVEGFAPECAWVTLGGSEELPEKLCISDRTAYCIRIRTFMPGHIDRSLDPAKAVELATVQLRHYFLLFRIMLEFLLILFNLLLILFNLFLKRINLLLILRGIFQLRKSFFGFLCHDRAGHQSKA